MTGQYKGVQAIFSYLMQHKLNLCGMHLIFWNYTSNLCFFFFSSSTNRWDILTSKAKSPKLKSHCDTKWASKYSAVHALLHEMKDARSALYIISKGKKFGDGMAVARIYLSRL